MGIKIIWILTSILILQVNSANILIFLGGGNYSHKLSIWPLVSALADRGHNVTVLSPHQKSPTKHGKVHDLVSTAFGNKVGTIYNVDRFRDRLEGNHLRISSNYNDDVINTCEIMVFSKEDPSLSYVLEEGKFDLIISNLIMGECGMILAYKMKTKLILFNPTSFFPFLHDEFGFPDEPSTVPDMTVVHYFPMGILSRFRNYFTPLWWFLSRRFYLYPRLEGIIQKAYGLKPEEVPSFSKDIFKADLVFIASHHSTDFARSYPPFMVNIGGMQCWGPSQPLEGEFKAVLDKAIHGAVLVAFGSTVNLATMPEEIKAGFLKAMSKFPDIIFIWKWNGPEPENKPGNLILYDWLPQFQMLGHPNVKAFISHAGLNSLSEATYHGVPVILVPLFADQDYHGYRVEATEVGIRLEIREFTPELLTHSVDQILHNPKYTKNMKARSAIFKDRPMNPIETGVYWTEFVLRHDDFSSLKPLQNLTFFQRRLLDVVLTLLLLISLVLVTIVFGCLWLASRFSKAVVYSPRVKYTKRKLRSKAQ